ncbi:MAG: prepilin-type N-terminal cleavage/methylation domain-containing protein [bacterium]|nr:prepilin-type N-terminal cleavage/methylation domain-containing protein [bacterium]
MKGFTLIELLVVSGIVVLLTGLMVPSWRSEEGALALERAAAKISQDIEHTKDLSLQAKWFECETGKIAGYGVYFTSNATSYVIFADCNNNQRYDSGTDGVVENVSMESAVRISSVSEGAFGLVIVPPDPAVYLKAGVDTLTSAEIIVSAESGGAQKTITINQRAVVSIQ